VLRLPAFWHQDHRSGSDFCFCKLIVLPTSKHKFLLVENFMVRQAADLLAGFGQQW
jgi:hypothetical protein